jgi:hypothetical protein
MVFTKKQGGAAAAKESATPTEPAQPSREEMAYAIQQETLRGYDDALNTALHYLILANAPVWARLEILKIRTEFGFDNSQWQTPANAQKE